MPPLKWRFAMGSKGLLDYLPDRFRLALCYVVLRTIDHFNLGGEYAPAIKESIRSIRQGWKDQA